MCPALEVRPPERWEREAHCVGHSHMIGVAHSSCAETEITQGGGVSCPRPRSWSDPVSHTTQLLGLEGLISV